MQQKHAEVVAGRVRVELAALAAARPRPHGLGAEREDELDVGLDLARVERAVEPAVLDRAPEPDVVQVDPVVPRGVAVDRRGVVVAVPGAVDVLEVARALLLDLVQEGLVDAPAPAGAAGFADPEGVLDQPLLLVDDLDQVAQALGAESGSLDVDVDPAAAVGLGAGGAQGPDDLLQFRQVLVGQDRADHLGLAVAAGVQAAVGHHLPGPAAGVGDVPGVVAEGRAHVAGGAADHPLDGLGHPLAGLADRLDLDAEAERPHRVFSFVFDVLHRPHPEDIQASFGGEVQVEIEEKNTIFKHLSSDKVPPSYGRRGSAVSARGRAHGVRQGQIRARWMAIRCSASRSRRRRWSSRRLTGSSESRSRRS